MTIEGKLNLVKNALDGYLYMRDEILMDLNPEIIEKNQDQLHEGLNSLGESIEPEYTPFTIAVKKIKGQPWNRVTLFDGGDFQEGMFSQIEGDELVISSTDYKTGKLTEKYGISIFGLNNESKDDIQALFIQRIIERLKEII